MPARPARTSRGGGRSIDVSTSLALRFQRWRNGERAALLCAWEADRTRAWSTRRRSADRRESFEERTERERSAAVSAALALFADGEISRAMRMLHSLGIADLSASVLLQLRRKHPERDRPVPHDLPVQVPAVRVSLTDTPSHGGVFSDGRPSVWVLTAQD